MQIVFDAPQAHHDDGLMMNKSGSPSAESLRRPLRQPGIFASAPADFLSEMRLRDMGDRIIELGRGASATV
ncbi:hypothetical protein [Mycobacterium sp.]|uniref:hypothetical protein n=1 Tax=Mycobacterium sp. TaxID=1785 RepID=UPI002D1719AD|nr:hypothetical protein [Mycobacterium sp.]HTY34874.1 hypothetical protein [Mycobacterium sp.]